MLLTAVLLMQLIEEKMKFTELTLHVVTNHNN